MLLPGCHIVRTFLYFTVLIAAVISYPFPEDEKTFNFKIGFDISKGANGAPEVLVRDFEDSRELNPRASDTYSRKSIEDPIGSKVYRKAKELGAVSSKSSESSAEEPANANPKKKSSEEAKSKEETGEASSGKPAKPPALREPNHSNDEENDDDGESDIDSKHSTRGMGAEDFEPEEKSPRVHKDDDDDDGDGRRRSKRAADLFLKYYNESKLKRKHKKALQVSIKPQRTTYTPYVF